MSQASHCPSDNESLQVLPEWMVALEETVTLDRMEDPAKMPPLDSRRLRLTSASTAQLDQLDSLEDPDPRDSLDTREHPETPPLLRLLEDPALLDPLGLPETMDSLEDPAREDPLDRSST